MADHAQLKAEPREMIGKKVRALRRKGILPATVYGHNVSPANIQVNAHDLLGVLRHSGRSQLIDLVIGNERVRPVFIKQTEVDAKRNVLLHVEFYQANLRELMHARIPIQFTGESPAVKDGGILLTILDHVEVECLPDNVPAAFEVDLSTLVEVNSQLHVSDLPLPDSVTVLTAGDDVIAKVNAPVSEAALEEAVADTEPLPAELGGEESQPDAVPEA